MQRRMYLRLLATLFFVCICAVIYCANLGLLRFIGGFLGEILAAPGFDKLAHLVLYGMLALLFNLAWPKKFVTSLFVISWASVLVLGFALLEEASQLFMSMRSADFGDVMADMVGVFLASKASRWNERRVEEKGRGNRALPMQGQSSIAEIL